MSNSGPDVLCFPSLPMTEISLFGFLRIVPPCLQATQASCTCQGVFPEISQIERSVSVAAIPPSRSYRQQTRQIFFPPMAGQAQFLLRSSGIPSEEVPWH